MTTLEILFYIALLVVFYTYLGYGIVLYLLVKVKELFAKPKGKTLPADEQLVWVTVVGYFAFGDFPDFWSLIGIAILMASGIYTATHQHLSERMQRNALSNEPPGA